MKKRDLEIALEKVPPFENPDPALEQYPTPASIVADIMFGAYARGDVAGMKVMDLGCGTGIFSYGAWLLSAGMVVGYDISENALKTARGFAASAGADIDFKLADIKDVTEEADTVFMNPPFGCQKRNADRPFLDKALELSDCLYSIHMADTADFIREYAEGKGRAVVHDKTYKYDIPHTFSFHTKEKQTVEIVAVNIR